MKPRVFAGLLSLCSVSVFASVDEGVVEVSARRYSSTNCGYGGYETSDFHVSYQNGSFGWGTRVELVYGFSGWQGESSGDWLGAQTLRLDQLTPANWAIDFEQSSASRGEFGYSSLDFVVRVTGPTGEVSYQKGGDSAQGYFTAALPDSTCSPGDLQTLSVQAVDKD